MTRTKDIIFLLNMLNFLVEDVDDDIKLLTERLETRELTDIEKGRLQALLKVKKNLDVAYQK